MAGHSFRQDFERALTLHRQGRLADAEQAFLALRQSAPGRAEPLQALARLYMDMRQPAKAADSLEALSRLMPDTIPLHDTLAALYQQLGQPEKAVAAYSRLHARMPGHANTCFNLAFALRRNRQFEDALTHYDKALAAGIAGPEEAHLNKAVILADDLRRESDARTELAQALALNPTYTPALLNLGNLEEESGNREAARTAYDRILAVDPTHAQALARMANVAHLTGPDDPLVGRLRAAETQPGLDAETRAGLGFALGKLLDSVAAYDGAFTAYAQANRVWRQALPPYSRAVQEKLTDEIIATFSRDWFNKLEPMSDASPIFICGMFRSGSTLLEQVLGSHPDITPGGELDFFPNLARTALAPFPAKVSGLDAAARKAIASDYLDELVRLYPGARHVTDKRPDNFLFVGLIKSLFPNARIIHTRRDALDNCLSVYFLQLGASMPYANDLLDIGHYWREQNRLMAHWKDLFGADVQELSYDALVARPRETLEPLLAHLGLGWSDDCLNFHALGNVVKTASYWQVREPLYTRSSGRARHYARMLAPLRDYLEGQA